MMFVAGLFLLAVVALAIVVLPMWRRARRTEAALGGVFVAGLAIGLYLVIGRPDLALDPPAPRSADMQPQDIEAIIEQLAERLAAQPDDPQGWTMLGRSYVVMGRYEEAAAAFAEAQARSPEENPDLLASFAEARTLANPAGLESEIGALFERVLVLDPGNARGLWYGGLAAQARGEPALAVKRWQQLLQNELPQEFRDVVAAQIAALDPEATSVLLHVEVDIAPELADGIPHDGVLYLFVRAADGTVQGPPLAAQRIAQPGFPLRIALTPAHLLNVDDLPDSALRVTARIARDGDPAPRPGDVEGSVEWNPSEGDRFVSIVLDSRRE